MNPSQYGFYEFMDNKEGESDRGGEEQFAGFVSEGCRQLYQDNSLIFTVDRIRRI